MIYSNTVIMASMPIYLGSQHRFEKYPLSPLVLNPFARLHAIGPRSALRPVQAGKTFGTTWCDDNLSQRIHIHFAYAYFSVMNHRWESSVIAWESNRRWGVCP